MGYAVFAYLGNGDYEFLGIFEEYYHSLHVLKFQFEDIEGRSFDWDDVVCQLFMVQSDIKEVH